MVTSQSIDKLFEGDGTELECDHGRLRMGARFVYEARNCPRDDGGHRVAGKRCSDIDAPPRSGACQLYWVGPAYRQFLAMT